VRSENKRDQISGKNEKRRNTDARYFSDKGKVLRSLGCRSRAGRKFLDEWKEKESTRPGLVCGMTSFRK
jgi:hypothetical protein